MTTGPNEHIAGSAFLGLDFLKWNISLLSGINELARAFVFITQSSLSINRMDRARTIGTFILPRSQALQGESGPRNFGQADKW